MYSLLLFPIVHYVWNCFHFIKIPLMSLPIPFSCCLFLFQILVDGMRLALKHNRTEVLEVPNFIPFVTASKWSNLPKLWLLYSIERTKRLMSCSGFNRESTTTFWDTTNAFWDMQFCPFGPFRIPFYQKIDFLSLLIALMDIDEVKD